MNNLNTIYKIKRKKWLIDKTGFFNLFVPDDEIFVLIW